MQAHRYSLRVTEYAEQGLEDIGDYIAFELKNSKSVIQMIQSLHKEITSLTMSPGCHKLDEGDVLASLDVRKCYYKSYKIHYMLQKQTDAVIILRALHILVDSRTELY